MFLISVLNRRLHTRRFVNLKRSTRRCKWSTVREQLPEEARHADARTAYPAQCLLTRQIISHRDEEIPAMVPVKLCFLESAILQ